MSKKSFSSREVQVLKILYGEKLMTVSIFQRILKCSVKEAAALMDWASNKGYVSNDNPRQVNYQAVKQALQSFRKHSNQ